MKRKYVTLNEEMNRMKSLFGESRLYGNLVDSQKDDLITEQPIQRLKNLFKVNKLSRLKNVESVKLDGFYKGLNFPEFDDLVNHIMKNKQVWQILLPNVDWDQAAKILNHIEINKSQIATLTDVEFKRLKEIGLKNLPEEGGMQDIFLYMVEAQRPKMIGDVVHNQGDLLIHNGKTIAYFDSKSNSWKNADDVIIKKPEGSTVKKNPAPATDVVPTQSTLKGLDGQKLPATPQNLKNGLNSLGNEVDQTTKKGGSIGIKLDWEGDVPENIIEEFASIFRKNGGVTQTKGEFVDQASDAMRNSDGTPLSTQQKKKAKKNLTDRLKDVAWGTRFVWNPTTAGEKYISNKWGKNLGKMFDTDPNNLLWNSRLGQIVLRTFLFTPVGLTAVSIPFSATDDYLSSPENNLATNSFYNAVNFWTEAVPGIIGWGSAAGEEALIIAINATFGIDVRQTLKRPDGITCKTLCGDCNEGGPVNYSETITDIVDLAIDNEFNDTKYNNGTTNKENYEAFKKLSPILASRLDEKFKPLKNLVIKRISTNEDFVENLSNMHEVCKLSSQDQQEDIDIDSQQTKVIFVGGRG